MSEIHIHWNGSEMVATITALSLKDFDEQVKQVRVFAATTWPDTTTDSVDFHSSTEERDLNAEYAKEYITQGLVSDQASQRYAAEARKAKYGS